jgi:glutamate dehydrogenase (NAD(P)+)
MERLRMNPSGATAIVQGFGNVGSVSAMALAQRGVRIVGVSDHTACYYDPKGLDVASLLRHAANGGLLRGWSSEAVCDAGALLTMPCDVLVPAALEQVITGANAGKLRCRILAEGANGPTTPEADRILNASHGEIFVIPDILCNAGGVVVSYFEWVQDLQQFFWDEAEVLNRLAHVLDRAFTRVMARVDADHVPHRNAALALGVQKVRDAKHVRGLFP